MPRFNENFFSIVILGQMNPAILSHDFLVSNNILPSDVAPFASLLQNAPGEQFTQFVSTPVMSSIKYERYSLFIDSQRFQAADESGNNPVNSPILDITSRYFSVLKHTPVKLIGFNFKGALRFDNFEDEIAFDRKMGIDQELLRGVLISDQIRVSAHIRWPFREGIMLLKADKAKEPASDSSLQVNFEYGDLRNLSLLFDSFESVKKCHDEFQRLLRELGVL